MPRAVFKMFWDALGAGRGIAAYVKNLAADGAYYWVMALAVPGGDGFLSVRLKPSSPLFAVAQRIYAEVSEVEREVEDGDVRRRKASIDAGAARLAELLAAEGFGQLPRVHARGADGRGHGARRGDGGRGRRDGRGGRRRRRRRARRRLRPGARGLPRRRGGAGAAGGRPGPLRRARRGARREVVVRARAGGGHPALRAQRGAVQRAAGARGRRARRGRRDPGRRSDDAEPAIRALTEDLDVAIGLLGGMGFRIAASKLMTELVSVFLHDLRRDGRAASELATELAALAAGLADSGERLAASITGLAERIGAIESGVRTVDSQLRVVRALEVNGRVEGARLADDAITQLFASIARQVAAAREQLRTFTALREVARDLEAAHEAAAVRASIARAAQCVGALAGE